MSSRAESNAGTQRISEERRFDRSSWLMLTLASAVLLYSIALALQLPRPAHWQAGNIVLAKLATSQ
jgi:hypothetical protein